MKITLHNITVREVTNNYEDSGENGVIGYGGHLDIRPAYQREFIYKEAQRDEVINTVRKNFPLNTMYWVRVGEGEYELMDGQQRTISLCQYVNGDFSVEIGSTPYFFHNLTAEKQSEILDYELSVYICEGTDHEKLDWFKIINIAGEKLTDQELRNAIYTGPWLSDAKRWFSRLNAPAAKIGERYIAGTPIRQDYLERTLGWLSDGKIEGYMSRHQHDQNANELWSYFQAVMAWIELTFPNYRKEMKGLDWGKLYGTFKDERFDTNELETEVSKLLQDKDVTNPKGVYEYALYKYSGMSAEDLVKKIERVLNVRAFDDQEKRMAYERQKGVCPTCAQHFAIEDMEADHITPWSRGGPTTAENCQMLCKDDNRRKSGV